MAPILSILTYSVVAIVNLFPLLALSQTSNSFYYPTASAGQSFRQGEELNVSWTTNFTDPHLDLFCSNINNQTSRASADIVIPTSAIQQYRISDPSVNNFKIQLDYAPQPNCLLQIQDGPGPVAERPSFGTGVFAIADVDGGSATSIENKDGMCQCGDGKQYRRMGRRWWGFGGE
ncbi:MAG: hypothetical protein L6R36_005930 [Xanthoria steineri]|nr:MAG: hypothetical protein L6R36_005930 [Xanthoria steineri]